MGGTSYSHSLYSSRLAANVTRTGAVFAHDADIRSKRVPLSVHETLKPSIKAGTLSLMAGKVVRESRDSDTHPNSNAVIVCFDVTGSMREVPKIFVNKLPKLMSFLLGKNYLADPQILFAAVGDAYSDKVPLQIGQFESGAEFADNISNFYLEGGGGSQFHDSYELAMHYFDAHTSIDCFEKRGKKGYLFFLGDEMPYEKVSREQVAKWIGEPIQADLLMEEVLDRLREKYEVFWVFPNGSNYFGQRGEQVGIHPRLKDLFGQQLIWMENPSDVVEVIATAIAQNEGHNSSAIAQDLKDIGADDGAIARASKAIVPFAKSREIVKTGKVDGTLVVGGSDSTERL